MRYASKLTALTVLITPLCTSALEAGDTYSFEQPAQNVVLQAVIEAGTTSYCGMREAPHLIEHLLLTETKYGKSPVDAILSLRGKGITLSATTHSDYTVYSLEGPAQQAAMMGEALVDFLGRSSLPRLGFESEKAVIISEVRADAKYRSGPTLFERYVGSGDAEAAPCVEDKIDFTAYEYDDVQLAFAKLYAPDKIKVIASGAGTSLDLDAIARGITIRRDTPNVKSQAGNREAATPFNASFSASGVEIFFPIPGRTGLPVDAANAMADQIRLSAQKYIRDNHQLYSARTFVDQGLKRGWIRLEVPGVGRSEAGGITHAAMAAAEGTCTLQYRDDPIWKAYGSSLDCKITGSPYTSQLLEVKAPLRLWWLLPMALVLLVLAAIPKKKQRTPEA